MQPETQLQLPTVVTCNGVDNGGGFSPQGILYIYMWGVGELVEK